jgi:hypothetical protein
MRGEVAHEVLDHLTDATAIVSLAWLSANSPEPLSAEVVGAIATIALGQRYAKHKWGGNTVPTDEQ